MSFEDTIQHFGEEFVATGEQLKKRLSVPNFVILNTMGEPVSVDSMAELKAYLQSEIDAFQAAINELED